MTSKDIAGLREQVLANSALLFGVSQDYYTVVVLLDPQHQYGAMVVNGHTVQREMVPSTNMAFYSAAEALTKLLDILATGLFKKSTSGPAPWNTTEGSKWVKADGGRYFWVD